MNKRLKYATMIMLTFCMVFVLAACGTKNNNANNEGQASSGTAQKATVTFGFWGTAQDLKIYQDAAANISSQYPNINLKVKQYPSSDQFWNTLPGEIAAGVAPDFIKTTNEGSYEYISKGMFAPLDDLIGPAGVDMNRYQPAANDIWKVEGNMAFQAV
jgi:multiple sugar transport system substrate-binding protein